ncbi:MAG TPA: ABC transporter permease [Gemmatimonadales bacterium]|nr:ABC transporter permease [Gemmatimonadales bacterium]
MKSSTLFRVAAQSILKNRMRTLLTMLGIVIGVGAVIVMVAIGQGAQSQIEDQIKGLGTNMIVITPGTTTQGGASQGAGTFNRLTVEDAEKLARESTTLAAVSPVIMTRTQVIGGSGNWRTQVNGVSPDYLIIRDWGVADGALFGEEELQSKRRVVVLGSTVAENLFPDGAAVGAQVQLGRSPFTVVGVLQPKGQTATGANQDDVVLVPYTTAQDRLSGFSFIGQILVSTTSPERIPASIAEIGVLMRESHGLQGAMPDDFTVQDQTAIAATATSTTSVMTALLAAIASISLIVGGIGIMNIMLVSVTERTREIGIRMAIGARGSDVLTQFLIESIVMSVLGGIIGLAVGFAGAALLGHLTGWATATPISAVVLAVGFSAAVGVFFGYYPARKAAALNPIDALRFE